MSFLKTKISPMVFHLFSKLHVFWNKHLDIKICDSNFLLGDNNFLNRIAITFNNLPENIRSQIKFSSFNNLSYRHFMSHDWPYFWHLTDIWSNWQWFRWHSSYSTTFIEQYHLFLFHFIIFLSHHGKHSKEWCCLTIKVYIKWHNY